MKCVIEANFEGGTEGIYSLGSCTLRPRIEYFMLTCIITNCGKRHCVFLSNIGYIFSSVSSVDIENLILEFEFFFKIDETQYSYVTSLRSNHVLVINLDTIMHKQDFILVMGISQSSFHLFTECIFSLEVHKNNAYLQDGRRVLCNLHRCGASIGFAF